MPETLFDVDYLLNEMGQNFEFFFFFFFLLINFFVLPNNFTVSGDCNSSLYPSFSEH